MKLRDQKETVRKAFDRVRSELSDGGLLDVDVAKKLDATQDELTKLFEAKDEARLSAEKEKAKVVEGNVAKPE